MIPVPRNQPTSDLALLDRYLTTENPVTRWSHRSTIRMRLEDGRAGELRDLADAKRNLDRVIENPIGDPVQQSHRIVSASSHLNSVKKRIYAEMRKLGSTIKHRDIPDL